MLFRSQTGEDDLAPVRQRPGGPLRLEAQPAPVQRRPPGPVPTGPAAQRGVGADPAQQCAGAGAGGGQLAQRPGAAGIEQAGFAPVQAGLKNEAGHARLPGGAEFIGREGNGGESGGRAAIGPGRFAQAQGAGQRKQANGILPLIGGGGAGRIGHDGGQLRLKVQRVGQSGQRAARAAQGIARSQKESGSGAVWRVAWRRALLWRLRDRKSVV